MTKWNDIPYSTPSNDEEAEQAGKNFDAQYEENQANAPEDNSNPYSEENFGK